MNVSSVKNLNGEVFSAVQDASLTNVVQTNSGNWQDITAYQNASATYLTAVDLTPYATIAEVDSISSMLSGAIDYVSANAGDEFPVSADEAIQYVQTNSGTIDDTVTSYQTNSGTFLTAHQAISADEWNDCYDNVNTNSGSWGGSALPISAGPGIKVNLVDNTLVFSNDETVLYDNPTNHNVAVTAEFVMSETLWNFHRAFIELDNMEYTNSPLNMEIDLDVSTTDTTYYTPMRNGNSFLTVNIPYANFKINEAGNIKYLDRGLMYGTWTSPMVTTGELRGYRVRKVIGINRK
jgi:hypothetical protein